MTEKEQHNSVSQTPVPPPVVQDGIIKEDHPVPEYLKSVYGRRYFHPFFSKIFDDEWMAAIGSFFCQKKLTEWVTNEIFEGNDVLQLGVASGNFEKRVAEKINGKGQYHIEDLSEFHIKAAQPRLSFWLNTSVMERDFTLPETKHNKKYNAVIGYFLLHELPDVRKRAVLQRALNALKPGGKMIFVDYAQPKKFHPMKYPVKIFNRLFEPFAESLWHTDIIDFLPKKDNLIWDRKTLFGDMYQCVIARKN